jgi:hypothetical protein
MPSGIEDVQREENVGVGGGQRDEQLGRRGTGDLDRFGEGLGGEGQSDAGRRERGSPGARQWGGEQ